MWVMQCVYAWARMGVCMRGRAWVCECLGSCLGVSVRVGKV